MVWNMITKGLLVHRLHEKQMFDTEFKDFIKDKKFPLEERWDLFKFACENNLFVNLKWQLYDSKLLSAFIWYYVEDYQTVYFTEVIQFLSDKLGSDLVPKDDYEDLEDCLRFSQEEINALKEEFLSTGYSGFVSDW